MTSTSETDAGERRRDKERKTEDGERQRVREEKEKRQKKFLRKQSKNYKEERGDSENILSQFRRSE